MIDIAIRDLAERVVMEEQKRPISHSQLEDLDMMNRIESKHCLVEPFSLNEKEEIHIEKEDIEIEKEENEDRIKNTAGTFFIPLEITYEMDNSNLGNLNDVGKLLQEISQRMLILEGGKEIQNTIEILQQLLPMKESIEVNTLPGEFPIQEKDKGNFQLLVEKFSQLQDENQNIEVAEKNPNVEVENEDKELIVERQGIKAAAELQNDSDWDSGEKEESEEAFIEAGIDKNEHHLEFSTEQLTQTKFLAEADMTYEKATLDDLADILQQKIEHLQKFIIKTDKAFIQLTPKNLGEIDVVMQKIGDKLMIEVDVQEQLAKKQIEAIFEGLQVKLHEKNIEVQLSFIEKDAKEREKQEKQKQQRTSRSMVSQRIFKILGGVAEDV